jgi:hypothetical protein
MVNFGRKRRLGPWGGGAKMLALDGYGGVVGGD